MASVERKQDEKGPFYLGYGSRRQTSAEIVTEARHSLRTLQTQRPFTPREEHRQLFGGSARTRDGRPPSSFSLHARNFEAPDSRPSSGTRLLPLEHKPRLPLSLDLDYSEVEKGLPKPPAERLDKRGSGSARTRLVRARSLTLVPSMTQHSNVPQTERVDKPTLGMTPSQQVHTESFYLHSGCKQERTEKSSEILTQKLTKHSGFQRPSSADLSQAKGTKTDAERGCGDKAGSDATDESVFWTSEVLPILQMFESFSPGGIVSKETVERLCDACASLHNVLAEKGLLGRRFKKRSAVLRALFRLIDLGSDQLNLTLANIILALNVSGNNLLNICKLVFNISRSSRNDFLFQDNPVIDSLLSLIQCEDFNSSGETVLYCIGSLKLLSGNSTLARLLLGKDFIAVSLRLSQRLIQPTDPKAFPNDHHTLAGHGQHPITGHILVQVTGALRNMADLSESRSSFLSDDVFSTLCAVMDHRQEDEDICLNVARIFSKLSSYAECCYALAETSSCYRLFLALLCKHSRKQALVVRLLFTLGNLAARSNDARERVYEEERSIDILLELFQSYLQVSKNPPNSENYTQEDEDVLIKLIRVLANLSIHPTVGTALAANTLFVQLLLKVMELRSVEKSTELVVNASTAINNLSYYQGESSIVRIQHAHVSQLLLQLLLSTNTDAVLEAIRVFGNLSQIEEVQQFIITNKVLQFVVALLDSKNPDMCFSACGVLTNLSVDPKNRTVINEEGATPKLIDCLRDFGPQDWLLATQVCQTLWNCTEDREQDYAQELCTILSLYSDPKALQWPSSDDMKAYQEACWELEFLPVAERLKKRMQRYVNIPEPVSEPSRSRIPEVRPYKK
ncbi:armadillo repeat-containing protein 2 isoform X1 [Ictalurus furcatus]|uniref:armadillo repeat-containing protein 2 isoform X1 n=1 Tax=Ictalurus furcatus TaxID=66913 RepID=UPI00234FC8F0|nr:armadillo repeat-containing protein 2 isoform X1 [Ictalurus furcatus]XP_053503287.1 armadillo repeat-containing protein 2 isoform X1 [Ictalurus furcatus]XP_053503293.1 armadillo repeat-containing protein 2 isoform X1 [Ictalurus furcatus]XP_053503301.1 armadillo repeat-containing protein 2 isoform X1 [Ictalurus furcatus]XP_053503309.1 armadillo repeat-containing protein 2 isoform X1 [Ictalurus furcatus]XP_053503318.1 armadillo repeat-containing protein 2 isoform X1 [Ictalurus furcatus]XP_05